MFPSTSRRASGGAIALLAHDPATGEIQSAAGLVIVAMIVTYMLRVMGVVGGEKKGGETIIFHPLGVKIARHFGAQHGWFGSKKDTNTSLLSFS